MDVSPKLQFCGKNDSNVSGSENVDSKQEQVNPELNPSTEGGEEEVNKHYCNPIVAVHNGIMQTWPSCNSFRDKCNGGDHGETGKENRTHLEWTCAHEIERQDVEFGNLSFQEWYKIRYGTPY